MSVSLDMASNDGNDSSDLILGLKPMQLAILCCVLISLCLAAMSMFGMVSYRPMGGMGGMGGYGMGGYGGYGGYY